MTNDLMRKLDYWLGIPLCFLLTVFNFIKKNVAKDKNEKQSKTIKSILFIKLSELGAIIQCIPAINSIKKQYPDAELYFVTFKKNEDIFSVLNIIPKKNVFIINTVSFLSFVKDTLRTIRKIHSKRIDVCLDFEFFSRFTAVFAYIIGSIKRVGLYRYTHEGLYRGSLLTHKINYNPMVHISTLYLMFAKVMKVEEKDTPEIDCKLNSEELELSEVKVSEVARKNMVHKLSSLGLMGGENIFLINIGEGTLPLREWPLDKFATLIRMILNDENNVVIIIGIQKGYEGARYIEEQINNERCKNLVGKTTIVELLALFSLSKVLVVSDSGMAHLASLTKIKQVVVLFGPESPEVFKPLSQNVAILYSGLACSPCFSVLNHRNSMCINNKCMQFITPEEVYNLLPVMKDSSRNSDHWLR